jgi:hypothetical protein
MKSPTTGSSFARPLRLLEGPDGAPRARHTALGRLPAPRTVGSLSLIGRRHRRGRLRQVRNRWTRAKGPTGVRGGNDGRSRRRSRKSATKERPSSRAAIRHGRSGLVGITVPLSGALGRWQMEHPLSDRRLAQRRVTQQTSTKPRPHYSAAELTIELEPDQLARLLGFRGGEGGW